MYPERMRRYQEQSMQGVIGIPRHQYPQQQQQPQPQQQAQQQPTQQPPPISHQNIHHMIPISSQSPGVSSGMRLSTNTNAARSDQDLDDLLGEDGSFNILELAEGDLDLDSDKNMFDEHLGLGKDTQAKSGADGSSLQKPPESEPTENTGANDPGKIHQNNEKKNDTSDKPDGAAFLDGAFDESDEEDMEVEQIMYLDGAVDADKDKSNETQPANPDLQPAASTLQQLAKAHALSRQSSGSQPSTPTTPSNPPTPGQGQGHPRSPFAMSPRMTTAQQQTMGPIQSNQMRMSMQQIRPVQQQMHRVNIQRPAYQQQSQQVMAGQNQFVMYQGHQNHPMHQPMYPKHTSHMYVQHRMPSSMQQYPGQNQQPMQQYVSQPHQSPVPHIQSPLRPAQSPMGQIPGHSPHNSLPTHSPIPSNPNQSPAAAQSPLHHPVPSPRSGSDTPQQTASPRAPATPGSEPMEQLEGGTYPSCNLEQSRIRQQSSIGQLLGHQPVVRSTLPSYNQAVQRPQTATEMPMNQQQFQYASVNTPAQGGGPVRHVMRGQMYHPMNQAHQMRMQQQHPQHSQHPQSTYQYQRLPVQRQPFIQQIRQIPPRQTAPVRPQQMEQQPPTNTIAVETPTTITQTTTAANNSLNPTTSIASTGEPSPPPSDSKDRAPLLHEQPLLLQELVEQEKQEQQRQAEQQSLIPVESKSAVTPVNTDVTSSPVTTVAPSARFTTTPVTQQQVNIAHRFGNFSGQNPNQDMQLPQPGPPPPQPENDASQEERARYEQWLLNTDQILTSNTKQLEDKVNGLRKTKKSVAAKNRQAKKAGNEPSEADQLEIDRLSSDITGIQRQVEAARKQQKAHQQLMQDYHQKNQERFGAHQMQQTQNVQMSQNSPMNSPRIPGQPPIRLPAHMRQKYDEYIQQRLREANQSQGPQVLANVSIVKQILLKRINLDLLQLCLCFIITLT